MSPGGRRPDPKRGPNRYVANPDRGFAALGLATALPRLGPRLRPCARGSFNWIDSLRV
jgi:hypothetical protein